MSIVPNDGSLFKHVHGKIVSPILNYIRLSLDFLSYCIKQLFIQSIEHWYINECLSTRLIIADVDVTYD